MNTLRVTESIMNKTLVAAAILSAFSLTNVAYSLEQPKSVPSKTLEAQYTGCYQIAEEGGDGAMCRQRTMNERECKLGAKLVRGDIQIDANSWTTHEDYGCDVVSIARRGDGIMLDQACEGEFGKERLREYWSLQKVAGITLLIRTNLRTLSSTILVRCRGN